MRTTVIFDDDVAAAIAERRRLEHRGVSDLVNELVRAGLALTRSDSRKPFSQRTSDMGARMDLRDISSVLDELDGPTRR